MMCMNQLQEVISCRWVITEKIKEDGTSIVKSRLVARGFEDSSPGRTDSPTNSKQSLRLLFSIASSMNWDVKSMDIKAVFLQGDELERDVYVCLQLMFVSKEKYGSLNAVFMVSVTHQGVGTSV